MGEPLKKLMEFNESLNIPLVTPKIGEVVYLGDTSRKYAEWWTEIGQ